MTGEFRSDNASAAAPEILAALVAANEGAAAAYGDDEWTAALAPRFAEIFEREVSVYPVATGTAANALALSALCPPGGVVYCHMDAHVRVDEAGAPELFTGGARLVGLQGDGGKLAPGTLADALAAATPHGPHNMAPAVLSVSQSTEFGRLYTPAEVAALTEVARGYGLAVHMDGARFANAVAATAAAAADLTWRSGVDALSFGATKNGALMAEAVVIFDTDRVDDFERKRKRAGQLLSKMRFVSAQLEAYVDDGLWLRLARHANVQASRLAAGLAALPGVELLIPAEANEVFARLPAAAAEALAERGYRFHPWSHSLGAGAVRLVAAWDTDPATVDRLLETAAAAA